MLEDPTYSSVVRWGDEGDSFVVLEVGTNGNRHAPQSRDNLTSNAERTIYQSHSA